MSSTNKTTNYMLSQFLGTDHFSFLTDYNGDMLKIDTALGSLKSKSDGYNSSILNLETEQENNESRFETTATALQNILKKQSETSEALSEVQTTQNEHTASITDLTKRVTDIETKSKGILLITTNVTNTTATKYNPIFRYDPTTGIVSVDTVSLSASDAPKFRISGDIDISSMNEKDKQFIVNTGISFECGYLAYSVDQTIDGNRVTSDSLIPLVASIGADGSVRSAFFSIAPMFTPPTPITTDDGIVLLSYRNTKMFGHGVIVS